MGGATPPEIRVGFLSLHNPLDRKDFSGTAYYAYRALAAVPGVALRNAREHRPPSLLTRACRRLGIRRMPLPRMDFSGLDLVLGLNATRILGRVTPPVPYVMVTDATPSFLREFYGSNVTDEYVAEETRAVRGAAKVIYSSEFMARRAVEEFGIPEDRVAVVPFGVNLDELPEAPAEKPPLSPLRLLFIGKQWGRKGGDIAVAAVDALRARGVEAELDAVGGVPEELAGHPGVNVHGFLHKADPGDHARLTGLLERAHLMLLPTRADCTPMVVAEANSYATPMLITDVGGIGSLMAPGRNGDMLPLEADAEAWADRIVALTADPAAYAALSRSSFEHCHARLTWTVWAREVAEILRTTAPALRMAS